MIGQHYRIDNTPDIQSSLYIAFITSRSSCLVIMRCPSLAHAMAFHSRCMRLCAHFHLDDRCLWSHLVEGSKQLLPCSRNTNAGTRVDTDSPTVQLVDMLVVAKEAASKKGTKAALERQPKLDPFMLAIRPGHRPRYNCLACRYSNIPISS